MRDPVIAFDGFTFRPPAHSSCLRLHLALQLPSSLTPHRCSYERASIQAWFDKGKTTSPKTGAELAGTTSCGGECDAFSHYLLTGICSLLVQSSSLSRTTTCARAFRSGRLKGAGRGALRGSCSILFILQAMLPFARSAGSCGRCIYIFQPQTARVRDFTTACL